MNKILLVFMLLVGMSASAQEVYTSSGRPVGAKKRDQEKDKGFDKDNLIFGGGMGLQFGQVTNLGVAPVVGYKFSDKFAAGIGLGYTYFRIKDYFEVLTSTGQWENKPLTAHSVSASIWGRYLVYDNIFVQLEPEYNMAWLKGYSTNGKEIKETQEVPCILVGAGMRFPISDRASMVGMLIYDVLQDPMSPYGNGVYPRFGFNIGF